MKINIRKRIMIIISLVLLIVGMPVLPFTDNLTQNHLLHAADTDIKTTTGTFRVRIHIIDENNEDLPVTMRAEYSIKWTSEGKNWKLGLNPSMEWEHSALARSQKYSIPFHEDKITVNVRLWSLIDEKGNNVLDKYVLVDDISYLKLSNYQKTIDLTGEVTDGVVNFTLKLPTQISITKKPTIQKMAVTRNKATVYCKHFKHTSKKTEAVWKKIKKIQVQCATDKGFKNIVKRVTISKSKTSVTIKGLKKKTVYYVRVRYYDGTGYSKWSKVKKVKTKK